MADHHDPLCAEHGNTGWIPGVGDCQCELIERVVEREREERERDWAEAYARVDAEARAQERERLHRDGWATPEQLEAMIAAAKARVLIHERKRIAQEIDHRYQDIKRQPGHDMNPEYWDGVLDGLDIGEQIARKEQP